MKEKLNRRKFFKVTGAAVAGSAAALSGVNYGFAPLDKTEQTLADYSPYHRTDMQNVPVINMHTHVRDTENNTTTEGLDAEVKSRLAVMDKMNIKKDIILVSSRDKGERIALHYLKTAPERFIYYPGLDFNEMDKPDWPDKMVRHMEENVRIGARGLKMILGKPRTQEFCMPMDDPRLDPVYARAGELGLPIAYHSNDPEEFFYPPNRFNFWCGGEHQKDKGFADRLHELVSREELIRQQENMISKHPGTTFILVHMAFLNRQLALLADILDRHPNVLLDLSAAIEELGRSPMESAQFMTYYSDRILFGTDGSSHTDWEPFLHRHFICLETDEDNLQGPYRRAWNIHGLNLPKDALENIYYKNAEKLLAQPVIIPK
jgi:uncharacterized protein